MGFSRAVKMQLLVDTARYCCVCHRYKGVKVEIHHIEQEAHSGPNTYENAITLCFDCHADAGHYNLNHPRGTKFSPTELKKAKENWISLVNKNDIQQQRESDKLLCRYFVCENYEYLLEIHSGDLSSIPVEKPLLVRNEILGALGRIIDAHPKNYRDGNAWGDSFNNEEEYFSRYPNARVPDKSTGEFSYFTAIREPSLKELEKVKHEDGLLQLMLEDEVQVTDVSSIVACYEDGCVGNELQEEYIFRKVWGGFLAITNISNHPITLESISGKFSKENSFYPFSELVDDSDTINLPNMPIESHTTVLLPIAIIIPPLKPIMMERWSTITVGGQGAEQAQEITRASIDTKNLSECLVYGGQININSIRYIESGNIKHQDVHAFDLSNMYIIDKCWQCGSCPHLFLKGNDISYKKELLAHCQSVIGEELFIVPCNTYSIIIAEIEDEVTEIISIKINNEIYAENVVLEKSDFIEIPVSAGQIVKIVGQYILDKATNNESPKGIKRNDLVGNFLHSYSHRTSNRLHIEPINVNSVMGR